MKAYTLYAMRYALCLILIFSLLGCDAFVRKFTRKPKKEDLPKAELVLEPQEYKAVIQSKEELYRQYFLYWRAWHDELLNALSYGGSHKKQLDCVNEAAKNLEGLAGLLNEPMQKKLDIYIRQLKDIFSQIQKDIYSNNAARYRLALENLRRNILRGFSYDKVKDYLL